MASFSDAVQALAEGRLKSEVLLAHMEQTLAAQPHLLDAVLAQLANAYADGMIEAPTFAKLKAHAVRAAGPAASSPASRPATPAAVTAMDTSAAVEELSTAGADPQAAAVPVEVGELELDTSGRSAEADASNPFGLYTIEIEGEPIAVGSTIKERFVLDEILGAGGMGTVFKSRDLLKVEACDKNPWVALKVLNESFKKHPDAFIALQREASRQQRLAHPNIATVYDFDRSGDTVFLTMEYLEGQALNSYLRMHVRGRGGLPFEDAFPIIRGLGQALSYAHERDIVHSDFKPANCFLTASGTVKVLDFGIARVVQGRDESEKTIFDPSSLGALTPAYASPEMLNGEGPDPRDDVYALACVAYELLAGKHPYDRKSATLAREHHMTPAPIRGLARRQMRGLARALALTRAARTPTVEEFVNELQAARPRGALLWAACTIVALLLALVVLTLLATQRNASDREAPLPEPAEELSP